MPRSGRSLLLLLTILAVGIGASVAGAARWTGFRDDFSTFDSTRWALSSRPFGYGAIDPANVGVVGGSLGITLPGGKLDGGEVRSKALYGFGTYRARIKVADAPSSLTAFFLYKQPDYQQELDIELYNDSSGRVMLSTYSGGAQTHTQTVPLGFDPTADFHEYRIDYARGSVRFLVDGRLLQTWSTGLPRASMYLYVNAWFPSWLAGQTPPGDRATLVDWVDYTPA